MPLNQLRPPAGSTPRPFVQFSIFFAKLAGTIIDTTCSIVETKTVKSPFHLVDRADAEAIRDKVRAGNFDFEFTIPGSFTIPIVEDRHVVFNKYAIIAEERLRILDRDPTSFLRITDV